MLPYYFILIIGILCCLCGGNNRTRQIFFCAIFMTMMMLLSGMRSYDFNIDTKNYMKAYYSNNWGFHIEYLFYRTINIIRHPRIWLLCITALIYIPLFFELKSVTKYCCLAAFAFITSSSKFFTESFNIIRQCIAATFILGCFIYWYKDRKTKAIIMLIIATLFHLSSLIAIPFLFLKNLIIKKWIAYFLLLSTFLIGLSGITTNIISEAIIGLDSLGDLTSGSLSETLYKYSSYGGNGVGFNHNFIIATCFPLTALGLITYPNTIRKRNSYNYYYIIFLISTCIGNIIIPATQFGFRVTFALSLVQIIVFALAYEFDYSNWRWLLLGYLLMSTILFLYTLPTLMPNY